MKLASAEVSALAAQIDKKIILAPFDGELGIRKVNVGQYLDAGTPIVNIQDLPEDAGEFRRLAEGSLDLKVGQTVRMTTDAYPVQTFDRYDFHGDGAAGQPGNRHGAEVQGTFDNQQGQLRPGMFAKLAILLPSRKQVVVVPQTAMSYSLYGDNRLCRQDDQDRPKAPMIDQVERTHRQNR